MDKRLRILISLIAIMVILHLINIFTQYRLLAFGIRPGEFESLPFILTAPWVHGSWAHLGNNLVGLTVFSALCLLRSLAFFVRASLVIIVVTGALVWAFGRDGATHVGASGWIFGLWSLAIAQAWFQRNFMNLVIAVFVIVFYGGMAYGVLPGHRSISFESHLFGALSGIFAAYLLTRRRSRR